MTRDGALLLAGYGTDQPPAAPAARRAARRGVDARVWPYRPVGTVAALAAALGDRIDRADADRIHLVGHSFGGLVCAAATLRRAAAITSVTTINTPWRGTWVSYTGSGPIVDGLRWRSGELRDLRRRLAEHHAEQEGPRWLLLSAHGRPRRDRLVGFAIRRRRPAPRTPGGRANGHSISLLSPRLVATVTGHVVDHRVLDTAT